MQQTHQSKPNLCKNQQTQQPNQIPILKHTKLTHQKRQVTRQIRQYIPAQNIRGTRITLQITPTLERTMRNRATPKSTHYPTIFPTRTTIQPYTLSKTNNSLTDAYSKMKISSCIRQENADTDDYRNFARLSTASSAVLATIQRGPFYLLLFLQSMDDFRSSHITLQISVVPCCLGTR